MDNVNKIIDLNQLINEAMTHDEAVIDSAKNIVNSKYKEINTHIAKLKKELVALKKRADKDPKKYAGPMRHYAARVRTLESDINNDMKRSIPNDSERIGK